MKHVLLKSVAGLVATLSAWAPGSVQAGERSSEYRTRWIMPLRTDLPKPFKFSTGNRLVEGWVEVWVNPNGAATQQGWMLADGTIHLLPADYDAPVVDLQLGLVYVRQHLDKWGVVNLEGRTLIEPRLDFTQQAGFDPDTGLSAVNVGTGKRKKVGFIDRTGNFAFEPKFDATIHGFEDTGGIAAVKVGKKWGFIGRTGRYVVEPQFEKVWSFTKGEATAPVRIGKKWGYIDRTGKFVIEPQFEGASAFHPGHETADVDVDGKKGLIDRSGKFVVAPIPAQILAQDRGSDGITFVRAPDGKAGYLDRDGKLMGDRWFDNVYNWDSQNRVCLAKADMKWGLINGSGEFVVDPRFDSAQFFDPLTGQAAVRVGKKWGYIDGSGELVIAAQFDRVDPLYGDSPLPGSRPGLSLVQVEKRWGVIDASGKFAVEPTYDYPIVALTADCSSVTLAVTRDGMPGVLRVERAGKHQPCGI